MQRHIKYLLGLAIVFLCATPAHAQTTTQGSYAENVISPVQNYDRYNTLTVTPGMAMGLASNIIPPVTFDANGNAIPVLKSSFVPQLNRVVGYLYEYQPSGSEYIANIMENIGLPTPSRAYAQGTGYKYLTPLLPLWKVFRNVAYSLYIVMFVIVGTMIMLRTKVNAQTIISIQSALPNLLITLILITFSYAIVGFMIDIMYFLIYFVVYLATSPGVNLISDAPKFLDRILSVPAWNIIFQGRQTIVSTISKSLEDIVVGIGGWGGKVLVEIPNLLVPASAPLGAWGVSPFIYLFVSVMLAWQMIKLAFLLLKSYVMLIIQLITAPLQILMNALPGSKAFGEWLKKTASYLIPYPVVACMLLFAAVLIGPTQKAYIWEGILGGDENPLGVNVNNSLYKERENLWVPPFTISSDANAANTDLFTIIAFALVLMTPTAGKMAQDWLQVKESPYVAEVGSAFNAAWTGVNYPVGVIKGFKQQAEQRKLMQDQADWIGKSISKDRVGKSNG